MRLVSVEDLRAIYRPPGRGPVDKVIHHLDAHCVDFLAKSPFFVLSTSNAAGLCDGSPKGGPPGFVQVVDDRRLGWADFSGNNRLDSFQNLVTNSSVALLFLIPGLDETLLINGHADQLIPLAHAVGIDRDMKEAVGGPGFLEHHDAIVCRNRGAPARTDPGCRFARWSKKTP